MNAQTGMGEMMGYRVSMRRQRNGTADTAAAETTLRYTYASETAAGHAGDAVVLRASTLPDPPPDVIHVTVDWPEPAVGGVSREAERAAAISAAERKKVAQGDRVEVIKSRVSGVKSPPEWLEQYVGRSGVVLWTTADGAMVDLDADTTWFSYEELKPRE